MSQSAAYLGAELKGEKLVSHQDDFYLWTQQQAARLRARTVYPSAILDASRETGLPARVFPATLPFQPDDVMAEDYLPPDSHAAVDASRRSEPRAGTPALDQ